MSLNLKSHMAGQPGIRGHSADALFARTGIVQFHKLDEDRKPVKWVRYPDGREFVDPRPAFDKLGISASCHYADDTGREWGSAALQKREAMTLYHTHPELRSEFERIAEGFLWSLKLELMCKG